MAYRSCRTPQRCEAFLQAIAKGVSAGDAARAIGAPRRSVYEWRLNDDEFRRRWDEALDVAIERVESKLYKKAISGDLVAMIFWLKAHKPGTYNRKMREAFEATNPATLPGAPADVVAAVPDNGVRLYLPHNNRDALPPTITIEAEPERVEVIDAELEEGQNAA